MDTSKHLSFDTNGIKFAVCILTIHDGSKLKFSVDPKTSYLNENHIIL